MTKETEFVSGMVVLEDSALPTLALRINIGILGLDLPNDIGKHFINIHTVSGARFKEGDAADQLSKF